MSHEAKPIVATGKYAGCERVLIDGGMVRKLSDKEIQKFRAVIERFIARSFYRRRLR